MTTWDKSVDLVIAGSGGGGLVAAIAAIDEGLEPLVLEKREIRLKPTESVVARTAGMFRSDEPPLSPEELRTIAEEAFADEALERSE